MVHSLPDKGSILVVDDQPANLKILASILTCEGYQVRPAISGRLALEAVQKSAPDLILLDIRMPDMDGYKVCRRLKEDERTRDIPIIFVSAVGETREKVKAFVAGGVDFIVRPFQAEEVLARIRTHVALHVIQKRLEEQNVQLEQEIAERERIEVSLRESEERYRSVVETSHAGILIVDDVYKFIYVNDELCRMVGYSREELIGHDFREFLIDEDTRQFITDRYVRRQQGQQIPARYEFNITRKDGERRWVEASLTLLRDSAGNMQTVGQILDITERKRVEEALRAERDKAQNYLDIAASIILALDVDGSIFLLNRQGCDILECERDEVIGKNWFDTFLAEGVRESAKKTMETLMAGGVRQIECVEQVVVTARGDERLIRWHNGVIRDEAGGILGTLSSGEDITERKRMGEALRESEKMLASILKTVPIGICLTDKEGRYTIVNDTYCDIYDFTREEILGQRFTAVMPPDQIELAEANYARLLTGDVGLPAERKRQRSDGTVIYIEAANALLLRDDGQRLVISVVKDITERKQAEMRLKDALAEKDVLLKEIHHRVKNNLQIVSALLNFQADVVKDGQSRKAFQESQNRVQAMASIHEQLYRSDDLGQIRMDRYVQELVNDLRQSFGMYGLTLQVDAGDVVMDLDTAIPCGLIISELVSNALKHAFLSANGQVSEQSQIHVALHRLPTDGNQFELTVRDNGVGLPTDLDLSNPQTLGLRLAGMLTRQLQGTFAVVGAKGEGTTFRLVFPVAKRRS